MQNNTKEQIIKDYFQMWVQRDFSSIENIFASDIYYSECYGPEYFCLQEIYLWIDDMLKKQKVRDRTIKRFIHAEDATIVQWFFKGKQGELIHGFDGVSIVEVTASGKIATIKEYESKAQHIAPYNK